MNSTFDSNATLLLTPVSQNLARFFGKDIVTLILDLRNYLVIAKKLL